MCIYIYIYIRVMYIYSYVYIQHIAVEAFGFIMFTNITP